MTEKSLSISYKTKPGAGSGKPPEIHNILRGKRWKYPFHSCYNVPDSKCRGKGFPMGLHHARMKAGVLEILFIESGMQDK